MIPLEWLDQAAVRIAPHIHRTTLTYDDEMNIYIKWENHQATGSFKARGALNKVLSLEPWEVDSGLVTASAGNHGQGVGLAGRLTGAPVTVFVSEHAVPSKVEAIRSLGADIHLVEGGYGLVESTAIQYAADHKKTWISPYNDGKVIAGQGTLGLEVIQDLPESLETTWIIPVGGGGLLAGISLALEHPRAGRSHKGGSRPRVIGVQAEASAFMYTLFHEGVQDDVSDLPTLADGLAGSVEAEAVTIPMVKHYAEDILLVSEEDIAEAIAFAWHRYHERIEGAAAVALAAILSGRVRPPAVVVLSGGNIQPEVFEDICHRFQE